MARGLAWSGPAGHRRSARRRTYTAEIVTGVNAMTCEPPSKSAIPLTLELARVRLPSGGKCTGGMRSLLVSASATSSVNMSWVRISDHAWSWRSRPPAFVLLVQTARPDPYPDWPDHV